MTATENTTPSFPMTRRCPYAPPPEYEGLREQAPLVRALLPTGRTTWVVTRHEEARQVLSDPRVSTDSSRPGFPSLSDHGEQPRTLPGGFIDLDPPEHGTYRKLLIPEFGLRRVNAMRPGIQEVVDGFLDDILAAGAPADLVADYGLPIPSLVICQLLGVPYSDHEFFQSCTRRLLQSVTDPAAGTAALDEIGNYLLGLVERAETEPGDGLIGRITTNHVLPGRLTREEAAGMAQLLLIAGHETTSNMIPLGVVTLLEHPEQLAELRADPSLWPGAVEELLRYHSIVDWAAFDRMAVEDMDIGGQQVEAGDGIFVLGASANRDDRTFDDPDAFDIHRGARNHVAFGYGVHQCLGQNLARAELEIAYRTLFARIPTLRVATDAAQLRYKSDSPIFGLYELPVTW